MCTDMCQTLPGEKQKTPTNNIGEKTQKDLTPNIRAEPKENCNCTALDKKVVGAGESTPWVNIGPSIPSDRPADPRRERDVVGKESDPVQRHTSISKRKGYGIPRLGDVTKTRVVAVKEGLDG